MATKTYRIANSPNGIFLYPTPVDKANTFLVLAENETQAEYLKYCLDSGYLKNPIEAPSYYQEQGLHTDQRTPKYRLNFDHWRLHFLPNAKLDQSKAEVLENLITKKFTRLLQELEDTATVIADIQFRYSQQQQCSECDKLGINDERLQQWFSGLSKLF